MESVYSASFLFYIPKSKSVFDQSSLENGNLAVENKDDTPF